MHGWEAENRNKRFIARTMKTSAPLTRRHRMAVTPHLDCCTLWAYECAGLFVRTPNDVMVARERGTRLLD